jgi:hypothetical protein
MPIDPNIALGVKPIQFESPVNQMAKMYEMQNAAQSNKLNQMKMDEYQRGLTSNQEIKNYLANTSPDNPNYITGAYAIDTEFGMKLGENISKIDKEKALTKASEVETLAKTYNIYKSTVGGIIGNPTQANAIAKIRRAGKLLKMDTADDEAEVMALGEDPTKITQWASSLSQFINYPAGNALGPLTNSQTVFNDVNLTCNFMELSDSAMAIIQNSLQGKPVEWVCSSYANYIFNTTLPTAITTVSMAVPAKFNSLKSLLFTFRPTASASGTGTTAGSGVYGSQSLKRFLLEYDARIGSRDFPIDKPNTTAQFYSEFL